MDPCTTCRGKMTRPLLLVLTFWLVAETQSALYTPNRAGIQLDAPPGINDAPPAQQAEYKVDNDRPVEEPRKPKPAPEKVPYSNNERSPPRSSFIAPPERRPSSSERAPSSPTHDQRPRTPYISEGYRDAYPSQPRPYAKPQTELAKDYNSGAPSAFSNPSSYQGHNAAVPAGRIGGGQPSQGYANPHQPKGPAAYGAAGQTQPGGYEVPRVGQQSLNIPAYSPASGNSHVYKQPTNAAQPLSQAYPAVHPGQGATVLGQGYPAHQQANPYPKSNPLQGLQHSYAKPASSGLSNSPNAIGKPSVNGMGNPALPKQSPAFPVPFGFPENMKLDQNSPFGNLISFNSPRPFKSRAPSEFPSKDSILGGFSDPSKNQARESRPVPPQSSQPVHSQQTYPGIPSAYPTAGHPGAYNPAVYPQQGGGNARFPAAGGGVPGYYGYSNTPINGGQCFQYTFAAEAYGLSDIAPKVTQTIQKELNQKPYLAPLVGLEAAAKPQSEFGAFAFDNPISSEFDYSGFGFQKDDATPAKKYGYLLNNKAYPGNFKEGDFAGGYPVSMRPLDSSCPAQLYKLRSFFFHGGECFVVNPDFQQVSYHRCSRRECNFCGVNRGLSACVEDYRWFTVFAYCTKLEENSRIAPLRLILPVGCSCQHFSC